MPLDRDLLHPSLEEEKKKKHKKWLVQSPNSYFMDVKCPGCYKITTFMSYAQTVVLCVVCSTVLCQPTGGKARLTEGCPFRRNEYHLYMFPSLCFSQKALSSSETPQRLCNYI
ncbi:40S ribosomal protein S27-like [Cricetulus griseus]|uniref:40S ribosomal protein S27-like n=1 Tax=Cricetulus griseus TaxID=10029 RepID=UPI00022F4CE9|nr:40S ribosomal protein S27-like [Cricetulus griseus]